MQINGFQVLISGSYNAFNEGWNGAGVYMCSGLYVSETFKQPIYIGSAVNLQERIEWNHISSLNKGNHPHNPPLQNAWNKYGSENFIWLLLGSCEKENTLSIEQNYLDLYRPFVDEFNGFNINHSTTGSHGRIVSDETRVKLSKAGGHKGWKLSEETKKKMSESKKGHVAWNKGKNMKEELKEDYSEWIKKISGVGRQQSEETKRKISEKLKGRKPPPEERAKMLLAVEKRKAKRAKKQE